MAISRIKKYYYYLFKKRKALMQHINRDMDYDSGYLSENFRITRLPTVDIRDIVGEECLEIKNYTFLEGNSLLTDIMLLMSLAKSFKNCSFLEIGSWKGETVFNVSKHAKECYSVTLSKEDILKSGLPESFANSQGFFMNEPGIKIFYGDSTNFDFTKLGRRFDLIFIDADHTHSSVVSDTRNALSLLKDDNSMIVWHDYGTTTENVNPVILSAILDGMPADEHRYLYHVSNTICALYSRKQYKTYMTEFPMTPDKVFDVSMKIRKPEI